MAANKRITKSTMKFLRQDTHKKKRLSKTWRKPRGCDSKQRLRMQNRPIVNPGYGSPGNQKGIHKSGLEIVFVEKASDIDSFDQKKQGAIVSGKVGLKTKILLVEKLLKEGIKILNITNPEEYLKIKKESLKKKKSRKEEQKEEKETKKTEEKKSIEDKLSEEEKKKIEKKDIDKLLTKRT
ncbi:hypothetical protein JXC34_05960 [Candidatus Woesearchaeota archaeon]|nr:hypothetical protein [Candidatus Woesearchaeota archaeon]